MVRPPENAPGNRSLRVSPSGSCKPDRYTGLSLGQLKILQEAITLMVFVPFAIIYMKQQPRLDFLWAGLCIIAAVYFVFRSHGAPA